MLVIVEKYMAVCSIDNIYLLSLVIQTSMFQLLSDATPNVLIALIAFVVGE